MIQPDIEAVQAAIIPAHQTNEAQITKTQHLNKEQHLAFVYSTVNQFCDKYPAFTKGGVRAVIFNENTNGLAKSGAIVRLGRKVLINETRWFSWIESQNKVNGGA
jgi:hypothetical protein